MVNLIYMPAKMIEMLEAVIGLFGYFFQGSYHHYAKQLPIPSLFLISATYKQPYLLTLNL